MPTAPTPLRLGQLSLFDTEVERARLPTNSLSHAVPVQRWATFVAGFSVEYVVQCLAGLTPGGLVLDPFLGCGTTMVGAKYCGHTSIGYDPHPLFSVLARAKAHVYHPNDLDVVRSALRRHRRPRSISEDARRFLGKLFHADELPCLLRASKAIDTLDEHRRPLGVALFLKAAEASCRSQTDGIYKAPTSKKKSAPFRDALEMVYSSFRHDIDSDWYRTWSTKATAEVIPSSAIQMPRVDTDSVDAIVTSPPYLNNFDFAEMTRMQLYLLGMASSWGDITKSIRSQLITNTTTALKGRKDRAYQDECRRAVPDSIRHELDLLVAELAAERRVRAGKKEYDFLVFPYYAQIAAIIAECFRVLKPGARLYWVVSDAALYGNYVATQEHTAAIMKSSGFADVAVETLRRRGHRWKLAKRDGAPGKLGEYQIVATRP